MKRSLPILLIGAALAIVVARAAPIFETVQAGSKLSVSAESAQVKDKKSLFSGSVVAPVRLGDVVDVVAVEGSWYRVRTSGGAEGYLHSSVCATGDQYRVAKQTGDGGVTYAESTAAARGFNPDVEAEHRSGHPDLEAGYKAVDRIEGINLSGSVAKFRKDGGLDR